MSEPASPVLRMPPRWLMVVASLLIVGHLGAVALFAMGAESGPWVTPYGESRAWAPHFARLPNQSIGENYLARLHLGYHYHFGTNYPSPPGVFFEAILRDDKGNVLKRLKFPEDTANPLARHRQELLARALVNDVPLPPPGPSTAAPGGQELPTIPIWDRPKGGKEDEFVVERVRPHEARRPWPVYRPSDWSVLLAQSYARYLCREHGAASAEIVRHSQFAVPPMVLVMPEVNEQAFGSKMVASFGVIPR